MGIGKEIYDKTKVGSVGTAQSASSAEVDLLRFNEHVVNELRRLESEGKVQVEMEHHESSTGKRYIDLVRFKRLL